MKFNIPTTAYPLSSHRLYVPQAPTTYTLELTSRCNNSCVGCGNVFPHDLGEMPAERWRSLLDVLRPHLVNIRLTGGEPTLHAQFDEIIDIVDELNVPFVLFTNGVWRDRVQVIRELKDCRNLEGVLISLHGKDDSSHQGFSGGDTFAVTVESIQEATRSGLLVDTNAVLNRANFRDIEQITRFSLSLGAHTVAFSRYYGVPTPVTTLSEQELKQAIESVHAFKARGMPVRFNNNIPACFSGYPSKGCPAGITHCTVDPFGNVRPCNHTDLILGSLFEHTIEELWHSEKADWWRNLIPQACHRCAEFDRCRGGCKALALHRRLGQDPLTCKPLSKPLGEGSSRKVQLYLGALPSRNFEIRREKFGLMVMNRGRVLVVDSSAEPLLDWLDGTHSLQAIEDRFGQAGLDLVGRLYLHGLVSLEQ